jgi:hypothetical protein
MAAARAAGGTLGTLGIFEMAGYAFVGLDAGALNKPGRDSKYLKFACQYIRGNWRCGKGNAARNII